MTSNQHVDTDLLIDLIEDRLGPELELEIGQHLDRCPECESEVESLREIIGELHKPEVWGERLPEWTMSPVTQFSSELSALATRLEEEERTGRRIVEVLVELPQDEWPDALEQMAPSPRAGVARALLEAAHARLNASPDLSLTLTKHATRTASAIPADEYDSSTLALLRAACAKEQANAYRLLGRYRDALAALDAAAAHLSTVSASGLELAAVDFVRGTVLRDMGKLDEALQLAHRAADEALAFGDIHRLVHYRMLEAGVRATAGDAATAREITLELVRLAERESDTTTLALLFGNLGSLSVRLGDDATAAIHMRKAAELYGRLEMRIPSVRMRWTLALMLLRQGRLTEAEAKLAEVAQSFSDLHLRVERALVQLDLAEVLLAANRINEVQTICRDILRTLQQESVGPAVMTALAYLRESAAMSTLDAAAIQEARALLQQVPHERPFLTLHPPLG